MRSSWRIGRIFGVAINIDSSWVLIFVLFTWLLAGQYFPRMFPHESRAVFWGVGLLTSVLLFGSVLVHELCHSLVALRQGERVDNITLFILGGVSQIVDEPKRPWQEFSMAAAGPAASLVLALLFYLLAQALRGPSPLFAAAAAYLSLLNAGLGVFNLLPGYPMDGGRVLRSIVWQATGNLKKATRVASLTGQAISFLLIVLGVVQVLRGFWGGLWFVFIGWFLHSAAVRGYDQVLVKAALEGVKAKDLMTSEFATVGPDLSVESLVDDHILKKREGVFLVEKGEDLQGAVCLEDLRGTSREEWPDIQVKDVMTPRERLRAVAPDSDGLEVLQGLAEDRTNQVAVMDQGKVAGVICRADLLRYIKLKSELEK